MSASAEAGHADHDHCHEIPAEGRALTAMAFTATLHCLTGCALGEVTGMVLGTAFGLSNGATIALAIGLAFVFGYTLTSWPLLRSGMALSAVIPIALSVDTVSIATMEIVDNAIMVIVPGAMHAGLGDLLFWGSLGVALAIAGLVAVPVNRWLLKRGKGHAVMHETGIHGGLPAKPTAIFFAAAALFGAVVLAVEATTGDDEPAHHSVPAEGHQ